MCPNILYIYNLKYNIATTRIRGGTAKWKHHRL